MRRVTCISTSHTLRVQFRNSITTRHFPIAVRNRTCRTNILIRRQTTKIATYSIIIQRRTGLRFTILINVLTRILTASRIRSFKLRPRLITFKIFLFRSPLLNHVMVVPNDVMQAMTTGKAMTRARHGINIQDRDLLQIRLFRTNGVRTFTLDSVMVEVAHRLLRFRGKSRSKRTRLNDQILLRFHVFLQILRRKNSVIMERSKYLLRCVNNVLFVVTFVLFIRLLMSVQGVLYQGPFLCSLRRDHRRLPIGTYIVVLRRELSVIFRRSVSFFENEAFRVRTLSRTHRLRSLNTTRRHFTRMNKSLLVFAKEDVSLFRRIRSITMRLFALYVLYRPDNGDNFLFTFAISRFRINRPLIRTSQIFPMIKTTNVFKDVFSTRLITLRRHIFPGHLLSTARFSTELITVLSALLRAP